MTRAARWVALVAVVIVVVACVPTGGPSPEACAAPSVTLELALSSDGLAPGAPAVCRDQDVTLAVDSSVDGVLHVHGYDSEVPAFEVAAGEVTEIAFVAGRSGQFPIEFHSTDDPTGVEVGVFTVHEP